MNSIYIHYCGAENYIKAIPTIDNWRLYSIAIKRQILVLISVTWKI